MMRPSLFLFFAVMETVQAEPLRLGGGTRW
jgi:hypothetical protein